jgi:hypothetical protein
MKPLQAIFNLLMVMMLLGSTRIARNERLEQPFSKIDSNTNYILPAPAPKYFKSSLKLYMTPQNGHTCLPAIMAYVNQELCKGSRTTRDYVDQYEDAHPGVDVTEDGIIASKQKIANYIESSFSTKTYMEAGGLIASIDKGNPLLTTILSYDYSGMTQLHNILIVGYDSSAKNNPKIYYMDSRYGRIFNDIDVAAFNASSPAYTFSITGCK